jgi:EAL domain-containing protein (putative c-di-GMP-specific phosphodiesterase class I)
VDSVLKVLEATGLPPGLLELEITESAFLHSTRQTAGKLGRLQAAGISIALDDFGTGYSSLSYLRELPISTLKIDRAFIHSIFESRKNKSLTSTIIKMGHALGMELVAEGVETEKQQAFLAKLKCDRIQGYNLSKPIPESGITDFLENFDSSVAEPLKL